MQQREKLGIIIIAILIIILAISIWVRQTINSKTAINCQTACRQFGNIWRFPGAGANTFPNQAECISACKTRFGQ